MKSRIDRSSLTSEEIETMKDDEYSMMSALNKIATPPKFFTTSLSLKDPNVLK